MAGQSISAQQACVTRLCSPQRPAIPSQVPVVQNVQFMGSVFQILWLPPRGTSEAPVYLRMAPGLRLTRRCCP